MIKKFKLFEASVDDWDEYHSLKSQNPMNPQLVYEREPDHSIDKLIYDLEPGAKILDLGCGDGVDAMYFSSKGFDVTASDLSSVVIEENKIKEPNIKWNVYDISNANISGKYDLIFCRLSLHYFDRFDISIILNDIKNNLNENGRLYFTVKTQDFKERVQTGKTFLHKKEWIRILKYYFKDINIQEHSGKLYNIPSRWLEIECYL